jgi:hypothetical protein
MHGDREAAGGRAHGSLPQLGFAHAEEATGVCLEAPFFLLCVYVLREKERERGVLAV